MTDRLGESRLLRAVRAIIREALAPLQYHAIVRYRVVTHTATGARAALQAVHTKGPWPDLLPVSLLTGLPGGGAKLLPGQIVFVAFADGDPQSPVIVAYDDVKPLEVKIDASGDVNLGPAVGAAARYGDTATLGSASGILTFVPAAPPHDTASRVKV
jgi:hypothetical protein